MQGARLSSPVHCFCSMHAVGGSFGICSPSFRCSSNRSILFSTASLRHAHLGSYTHHNAQWTMVKQAHMAEQIPKYDCHTTPFARVWRTRSNGVHRLHRRRRKKKNNALIRSRQQQTMFQAKKHDEKLVSQTLMC